MVDGIGPGLTPAAAQARRPAPDEGRDVLADTAAGPGDGAAPEATALPERGPEITETR